MKRAGRRGVTLVELLVTIVIGSVAMLALTVPFAAERSFWFSGKAQTEAQRDAQLALRAMGKAARGSNGYAIGGGGTTITFTQPGGGASPCFQGGPAFGSQLQMYADCGVGAATALIDGNRSKVTSLTISAVTTKLVRVQIQVTHQNRRNELLVTDLFLRNAT